MRVCRVRYAMGVCLCAAVRFGSSPLVVPRLPGVHAPHTCLRAHGCITHRLYPMRVAGHLTIRDCSSTQTIIGNLSATTLGWAQMPTHYHGSEHCLAVDLGYDVSALAGLKIALTGSGTNILSTTWSSVSAGSSASHTHGISNPNHTHTASTKIDTRQASRALHYIMRCA